MQRVSIQEFVMNLSAYKNAEDVVTVWGVYDQDTVTYGRDDCNEEYCEKHGIPYYKNREDGGCIVNFAGTINIADFRPSRDGWVYSEFLTDFSEYLKEKGLNAEYDGNDILVDGYKVASGFGYNLPPNYDRMFNAIGFFFNQDVELIRHICLKPMVKEPKGLEEYDITTEECAEWAEQWFDAFDKKGVQNVRK